jgi:hypothetical protein
MSRTHKDSPKNKAERAGRGKGHQRNISVRGIRRDPVDLRRLSRALIAIAAAEAAAEADTQSDSDAAPTSTHDVDSSEADRV